MTTVARRTFLVRLFDGFYIVVAATAHYFNQGRLVGSGTLTMTHIRPIAVLSNTLRVVHLTTRIHSKLFRLPLLRNYSDPVKQWRRVTFLCITQCHMGIYYGFHI